MSKRHKAKADRFRIEKAVQNEKDFTDIFFLLLKLYELNGYAALDPNKAAGQLYEGLKSDAAWIARKDGQPVGTLVLVEIPYWYSQDKYLETMGFYVEPEHRGLIGPALMRAAREEAKSRGKVALITSSNPHKRAKTRGFSLEAEIAGFAPMGFVIRVK